MKRLPLVVEKFELLNEVMAVPIERLFIASFKNREGTKLLTVKTT